MTRLPALVQTRSGTRIEFANKLRGLAAVSVVFYHYAMFWIFGWPPRIWGNLPDITPVESSWLPFFYQFPAKSFFSFAPIMDWGSFTPIIDWGAFGVALFFLLSGFLIANSVQNYRAPEFLINRILRIYPTYAASFVFVLAMHAIAGWIYGRGLPYSRPQMITHTFPGLRQIFGYGYIDPIIWTLEVEIKFYVVVFGIMLIRSKGAKLPAMSIGVGIGVTSILLSLVGSSLLARHLEMQQLLSDAQFVCFIFIGSIFFEYWIGGSSRLGLLARVGVIFFLFALTWIISERNAISIQPVGRIWSYAFAILVFAIAMKFAERFEQRNGLADFYARISYPLYVVHLASGYLVLSLLHATSLPFPVDIGIAFGASTAIALVLHLAIEAPTMRLARRYVQKPSRKGAS